MFNEQAAAVAKIYLNELAQGNGPQAALDSTIERVINLMGSTSDQSQKAIARFVYDTVCFCAEVWGAVAASR